MLKDNKLNKEYQQIELLRYSEFANFKKWKILSDRIGNIVNPVKLKNISQGGSSIKCSNEWLLIENAIAEIRKEYENEAC